MDTQFIEIYHTIKNDIFRLAYSYTKNLLDAEDITQDVFIKLYENLPKFNDNEHIKKWCIKITINKCKNLFLSSWKKKIRIITEKDENNVFEDNSSAFDEVINALFSLSKDYRILIVLYYYEGYKVKEISKLLKVNESTIRTRLQRARNQLQILLKEEKV